MAKPRKKYNPAAAQYRLREQREANGIAKMRAALMGCTLSYCSTWGPDEDLYPSNFEIAVKVAKGDGELVASIIERWEFDWTILLTIWCESDYHFYEQPVTIKMGASTIEEVTNLVEKIEVSKAKKLCNPAHIKEWGFIAFITQHSE